MSCQAVEKGCKTKGGGFMIPCRRLVEAPETALDERKEPLGWRPQDVGASRTGPGWPV
ncbi:hypothetical protein SAMN02745177_01089 [Desulforamulus hydrothermalis Lam5 = DSM 18033]|nr:hypothetical protein SAMN02745177_01089 [Desulforamulus hydrothermalis Lam5 = DSM 18033]